MRKSEDRILVTHVGSLPRGEALNDLLIRSKLGEGVDRGTLDSAIENRVANVFKRQLDAGIDIANDGEQGRVGFQTYVADRMSGCLPPATNSSARCQGGSWGRPSTPMAGEVGF